MGLTTIKKRVKKTTPLPDIEIDVADFLEKGDKDTKVRFREPRSTDLFIASKRRKFIKAFDPTFSDEIIGQIALLASCYVPTKDDEAGVNLDMLISSIAKEDRDLFLHMVGKFGESFPMNVSKEEAGNG